MVLRWLASILLALWAVLSIGCGGSSLAARFPNATLRSVCAWPEPLGPDPLGPEEYAWVYTASGRLVSSANPAEFDEIAARSRYIFVFDVDAEKDSPSILPVPDNALECRTGFSWLKPARFEDAPATGCRGNCNLPSASVMFAPKPCSITLTPQAVAEVETQGLNRIFVGQAPEVRSPWLQPLPGVAHPPNC